jgi:hypothetical protein
MCFTLSCYLPCPQGTSAFRSDMNIWSVNISFYASLLQAGEVGIPLISGPFVYYASKTVFKSGNDLF